MFIVNVNGKDYQSETDMTLMDFLRDKLRITSVKNGCKEGACGTCTVIVDGKTVRACVQRLSKLEGKKIQTIEKKKSSLMHLQQQEQYNVVSVSLVWLSAVNV